MQRVNRAGGSLSSDSMLGHWSKAYCLRKNQTSTVSNGAVKLPLCTACFFHYCQLFSAMPSVKLALEATQSLRYHVCSQIYYSFSPSQATSREERFDQQTIQNPFGLPEPCLEDAAILSPTKITPVPKPRTSQPGKPQESRGSSDKQPNSPSTAEANALPPQNASFIPKVPPRRKKSAPAALHLQVLQNSDNSLLRELMFNSSNNNPGCPQPQDSVLQVASTCSALSVPTLAASQGNNTVPQLAPSTELITVAEGQPPLLSDSSSLAKNTNLLDLDTDSSCHLSSQVPSAVSAAHSPENLKLPSHWVTFSDDEDSGALSEGFNKLLDLEQNKNSLENTNNNLEL